MSEECGFPPLTCGNLLIFFVMRCCNEVKVLNAMNMYIIMMLFCFRAQHDR